MATYKRGSGNYKSSFIQIKMRSATQGVTSSSTVVNDNTLFVKAKANKNYSGYVLVRVQSHPTPDFKYTFAAITGALTEIYVADISGVPSAQIIFGTETSITTDDTTQDIIVFFVVSMGSTDGNIQFQWAQNTADGDESKVYKGSTMVVFEA